MIQLILVVLIFFIFQYSHIEVGFLFLLLLPQEAKELVADLLHAVEDELEAGALASVVFQFDVALQNRERVIQLILLQNTQLILGRMKKTVDARDLATMHLKLVQVLLLRIAWWKLKAQVAREVFIQDA